MLPEGPTPCGCPEHFRKACVGEARYTHESAEYCVLHFPHSSKRAEFDQALQQKIAKKDFDFRGAWFPDGAQVTAYFDADADFSSAVFSGSVRCSAGFEKRGRFWEARFNGTADFSDSHFERVAEFRRATFAQGATFARTSFGYIADFAEALFLQYANFDDATFRHWADFFEATFKGHASFVRVEFDSQARFSYAVFQGSADFTNVSIAQRANFRGATFADSVRFARELSSQEADPERLPFARSATFRYARIDNPERVSFQSFLLQPHWFVGVDPRRFDFIDVEWMTDSLDTAMLSLRKQRVSSSHAMLVRACRGLAINCEDNHHYEQASRLRYWAMDIRRPGRGRTAAFARRSLKTYRYLSRAAARRPWGFNRGTRRRLKRFWMLERRAWSTRVRALRRSWTLDWLSWLYWAASGYGERGLRAAIVLLLIWGGFAAIYTQLDFVQRSPLTAASGLAAPAVEHMAPLDPGEALTYSLGVMTLQGQDSRPAGAAGRFAVTLETILGPLQAALLALAIRRRFML